MGILKIKLMSQIFTYHKFSNRNLPLSLVICAPNWPQTSIFDDLTYPHYFSPLKLTPPWALSLRLHIGTNTTRWNFKIVQFLGFTHVFGELFLLVITPYIVLLRVINVQPVF